MVRKHRDGVDQLFNEYPALCRRSRLPDRLYVDLSK